MGLGATIFASFLSHSPLCPWVRWSNDHHRGDGWVPQLCGWRNWIRPGVSPWSTSTPVILKFAASRYLPHLPFGAIGPPGMHESGCTLEVQQHPYWLALELLVGDGPGAGNISQLQCGMWLVVLPAQGDHVVPLPIMTGWLTRLPVFCHVFCRWFCNWWPLTICYFLEDVFAANIFRFGIHSRIFLFHRVWCTWIILVIFISLSLVCFNYLELISPILVHLSSSEIVRILFSCELARLRFAVLVIFGFRLGSKLPCLFLFLFYLSWIRYLLIYNGLCAVSIFVLFRLFWFVGTWLLLRGPWCRMFVFFLYK